MNLVYQQERFFPGCHHFFQSCLELGTGRNFDPCYVVICRQKIETANSNERTGQNRQHFVQFWLNHVFIQKYEIDRTKVCDGRFWPVLSLELAVSIF